MKYQAKYTAQGQSAFFADGRASRRPVEGTIPYTGDAYRNDAGDLLDPDPDLLHPDLVYYTGRTGPDKLEKKKRTVVKEEVLKDKDGNDLKDKDGNPLKKKTTEEEEYEEMVTQYALQIPPEAIARAAGWRPSSRNPQPTDAEIKAGWKPLMDRGRERYSINCAVCHGDSGYGGTGEAAHGAVGRRGMAGIANYHDPNLKLAEKADGYFFDVITNGAKTMSAYGHQIKPQDRWAIVAYVRALMLSQRAPESMVPLVERQKLGGKR
jgi:mono/diheme cytochrome c family protein